MGREFITDGLTVGYAPALSQFAMTWALGRRLSCARRTARPIRSPRGEKPRSARPGADTGAGDVASDAVRGR